MRFSKPLAASSVDSSASSCSHSPALSSLPAPSSPGSISTIASSVRGPGSISNRPWSRSPPFPPPSAAPNAPSASPQFALPSGHAGLAVPSLQDVVGQAIELGQAVARPRDMRVEVAALLQSLGDRARRECSLDVVGRARLVERELAAQPVVADRAVVALEADVDAPARI